MAKAKREEQQGVFIQPIKPRNLNQDKLLNSIKNNKIVFAIGSPGTGKTFCAMGAAIHALVNGQTDKIIIIRPIVESGEKLGFLPGSFEEKIAPYLVPCFEELQSFVSPATFALMQKNHQIEVLPLAYARGRNLKDCYCVLDEAQNATEEQIFMLLTRFTSSDENGTRTKMIIDGDGSQSDLPERLQGGLEFWANLLESMDDVAVIRFTEKDIVRDPIVRAIVERYNQHKTKES